MVEDRRRIATIVVLGAFEYARERNFRERAVRVFAGAFKKVLGNRKEEHVLKSGGPPPLFIKMAQVLGFDAAATSQYAQAQSLKQSLA